MDTDRCCPPTHSASDYAITKGYDALLAAITAQSVEKGRYIRRGAEETCRKRFRMVTDAPLEARKRDIIHLGLRQTARCYTQLAMFHTNQSVIEGLNHHATDAISPATNRSRNRGVFELSFLCFINHDPNPSKR